jgi:NADPH-dependent ferric siderophore reductase
VHLEVARVTRLTPQLVRIEFTGPGLDGFTDPPGADSYVKLEFPPPGADYTAPYDSAAVRELPRELRPASRHYTVRAWDRERHVLTIDFVVHGDVGIAGRWAQAAQQGDRLQFAGPGGKYNPAADADWYLLVGDESAMPAIMAVAARVPTGRPVIAVLEVEDHDGEVALDSPGDVEVTWVHRRGRTDEDLLLSATRELRLPGGRGVAFVHGEAVETRHLRTYLLTEQVVAREDLSVSPYWRRGHTDEQWRSIKAAWQRDVELDVPADPG